jgi:hypothetical protein
VTMAAARRRVAKIRAAARPMTALTTRNLASHTATIQMRAPRRAGRNRSITPSRANITRASPRRPRPHRNLASPKLRAPASLLAAAINSRCGRRRLPAAAALGAEAVRHVGTSKK